VNQPQDAQSQTTRKREAHLSKDGQWRSFPKVPHLLQYVSNGNYYGRIKVGGKVIRESLKTDVWTTAKLRLTDFLKEHQEVRTHLLSPTFKEAVELYKHALEHDTATKPRSKKYRLWCLRKIELSWPDLWLLRIDEISEQSCKEWAAGLSATIACHYYNNTIATLRMILEAGCKSHKEKGGGVLMNPAAELKRVRIKQKDLQLPESSQFKDLVGNLRKNSGGWGPRIGDLVEFLAYSGMRIKSEALWTRWEDIDWQRKQIIVRGDPETGTKNSEIRRIPLVRDMEGLLTRMKEKLGTADGTLCTGRIMQVNRCNEALARACKEIGISRITHHDLRHLFATRCIESGVDIPTVSRWLGHKDGGALAMRTYGHLRNEHSQLMAEKVKF
jgi:integrase